MEVLMLKKIIILFKLGRKVAKSDILNITSKFHEPPLAVKLLFKFLSFSFSPKSQVDVNKNEGERLSSSLESMGTTFIKLGQFLATRPDIIGEELSKKLENLQDRLPPFSLLQAKEIIKNDLAYSVHDISSGGLIVALAEMSMNSGYGIKINKPKKLTNLFKYFFGEDQSRYVIEIDKDNIQKVEQILKDNNIFYENIGTTQKDYFEITGELKIDIKELYKINNQWYNNY